MTSLKSQSWWTTDEAVCGGTVVSARGCQDGDGGGGVVMCGCHVFEIATHMFIRHLQKYGTTYFNLIAK